MVKSAAAIDVIFSGDVTTRAWTVTDCIHRATIGVAGGMAVSSVMEAITMATSGIPGVDLATALMMAGADCYLALKGAQDFEDCMRRVPPSIN
ncbi:MAG: hypothetical protein HDR88_04535 [Bacteroides sp.]|nr:hypothetical protein [Bacteroides sp.]